MDEQERAAMRLRSEVYERLMAHERWLGTDKAEGSRMDLAGRYIPDMRASSARLNGANFARSALPKCDFTMTSLEAADFRGALLDRGWFTRANLQSALFHSANLRGTDFSGADLQLVDFTNADLTRATFDGANLANATFHGANLDGATFEGAMHMPESLKAAIALLPPVASENSPVKSFVHRVNPVGLQGIADGTSRLIP